VTFNSFIYYPFLLLVFLSCFCFKDKLRWTVLLFASFGFYSCLSSPYVVLILLLVILLNYAVGIGLSCCTNDNLKKMLLWGGVGINIVILAVSKYLPHYWLNVFSDFMPRISVSSTFVAIGISYFVFQGVSYLVDIYLGIAESERHLGYFALYIAFFPKLLQGPIERVTDLLPQLKQNVTFDYNGIRFGILLIVSGLFKKIVVADRLAPYVDQVYNNVHSYSGGVLIVATYLYAIQIFCDFSGYTDIALGSARVFNIQLTQNFNRPYAATSIADFWRRWHISFSRWILDYIFRPLQIQWRDWRTFGTALALIITFLISGLWHGASWGFVIWGGLHATFLVVSIYSRSFRKNICKILCLEKTRLLKISQIVLTFNLVCFAWIFFRANNIDDAFYIVKNITNGFNNIGYVVTSKGPVEFIILSVSVILLAISENKTDIIDYILKLPGMIRYIVYYIIVMIIILFGKYNSTAFIYNAF